MQFDKICFVILNDKILGKQSPKNSRNGALVGKTETNEFSQNHVFLCLQTYLKHEADLPFSRY